MTTDTKTASLDGALAHAARLLPREPALAASQAEAILAAVPNHPQAVLLLGMARRRQGDMAGAAEILAALATAQPRSAQTRQELGLARAGMGEIAAAIADLRAAVALAPGLAEAWRTLGDLLTFSGDTAAAADAYARQIRAAVNDPTLMEAADALCGGQLNVAERLLKARLLAAPTDVPAIRMLAEIATRLGRNKDAESLLTRCLELAPAFLQARHNLAVVLYRQNRAAEAIPHLEALRAADPKDPGYRNLLPAAYAMTAEYHRAIDEYAAVLKEFPRQPLVWMSYGHVLRTAGRQAETLAAYRTAIAQAPRLGEVWWSLANLKTAPFTPEDHATMRAQLARADITEDDRMHLHYALGRALEDAGAYADSFAHYASGAALRRRQVRYDADETTNQVSRSIALFTPALLAARAGQGCPDTAPIFVIGLPRSGSTLIEQILSSHSQVEGTMELSDMAVLAREAGSAGDAPYPDCLATMPPAALAGLGARYIERTRLFRKTGRPIFIDKMPNNWIHAGMIRLILPNAKIIDARRYPMAAGFSNFKQHFARGQHFTYDLTELGRYYCDYARLMAHFEAAAPGRIHRVTYEDMVADTEGETRRLLAYCGLDFEPACLRFWATDRAVRTASSEQVRRPIYREGLDQWRHYAPFLAELRAALAPVLN